MTLNNRLISKLFSKNNNTKIDTKKLKQKGQHIHARLIEFKRCNLTNHNYKNYHQQTILGTDPEYQLMAEWQDPETKKVIELKSRKIQTDEETIKYFFKTYRTVSIYLDTKNSDNYYFDLPHFIK